MLYKQICTYMHYLNQKKLTATQYQAFPDGVCQLLGHPQRFLAVHTVDGMPAVFSVIEKASLVQDGKVS